VRLGERWAVMVVLGLGLALGGCGGGSEDGHEAEAVEAGDPRRQRAVEVMAAYFRGKEDSAGLTFSRRESRCLADDVVDALGVDRLQGLGMDMAAGTGPGLTEPPLTTDEAEAIEASMITCARVVSRLANTRLFDDLAPDDALCVSQAYFDSGMARRVYFAPEGQRPSLEEVGAAIRAAGESCSVPGLNLVPQG
jgi:hypothetical protein